MKIETEKICSVEYNTFFFNCYFVKPVCFAQEVGILGKKVSKVSKVSKFSLIFLTLQSEKWLQIFILRVSNVL